MNELDDNIPIYNKIIAISFSVFDKFYKGSLDNEKESEDQTKFNNYTYIGLHKVDNSIYSSDDLIKLNKRAYQKIVEKNRTKLFVDAVNHSNILNFEIDEHFDYETFLKKYSVPVRVFSFQCFVGY